MTSEGNLVKIVTWDWRESPDLEEVNLALAEVYDGKTLPTINEIDTNCDSYAWLFSGQPVSETKAQAIFDEAYAKDFPNDKDPEKHAVRYPYLD